MKIVDRDTWLAARKALLEDEKALTRQRDAVARKRRELPWVRVEADYRFVGEEGELSLRDLFGDRRQLIVQHFMFGPDWEQGCKSCSFMSDHLQFVDAHLAQRDVAFVVVSRARLEKLLAFRARMGWRHRWVSSLGSRFNFDFDVSFEEGVPATYNFAPARFPSSEAPGFSVFIRDDEGHVFHTNSVYARGLDAHIGTYQLLDLVPRGRAEDDDPHPMAWVRIRDAYPPG